MWLDQFTGAQPSLAWCHGTDAYTLKKIITAGAFKPEKCPVFNYEELTYFFYGRPAYKNGEPNGIGSTAKGPVMLLMDNSVVKAAKRIFPFDTGAFADNRYARWMHPKMKKEDFEITSLSDAANKHVEAFFEKNKNYLDCLPGISRNLRGEFEAEVINQMLVDRTSTRNDSDDRRITVEMMTDAALPFTKQYLKAIIGPQALKTVYWMADFLDGAGKGVEYVSYSLIYMKLANEYQVFFENKAKDLQRKWHYL